MQKPRFLIPSPAALFPFEAAARHLSFTNVAEKVRVGQAIVKRRQRAFKGSRSRTL
jgi:hypothetical protein